MIFMVNNLSVNLSGIDYSELADGQQHSLAVSWDNAAGDYAVYVDGVLTDSGNGLATGVTVAGSAGTGAIVFGQEQDSIGGGFQATPIL